MWPDGIPGTRTTLLRYCGPMGESLHKYWQARVPSPSPKSNRKGKGMSRTSPFQTKADLLLFQTNQNSEFKVLSNQSLGPVSYKQIWRSLYPCSGLFLKSYGPPSHHLLLSIKEYLPSTKNRWTLRGRTWMSPTCSMRTLSKKCF